LLISYSVANEDAGFGRPDRAVQQFRCCGSGLWGLQRDGDKNDPAYGVRAFDLLPNASVRNLQNGLASGTSLLNWHLRRARWGYRRILTNAEAGGKKLFTDFLPIDLPSANSHCIL